MSITTISSREFNQHTSDAKHAAKSGPVFITDRGRTAHVLLSFDDYQKLTSQKRNIADSLSLPPVVEIEFEPPKFSLQAKPADLT